MNIFSVLETVSTPCQLLSRNRIDSDGSSFEWDSKSELNSINQQLNIHSKTIFTSFEFELWDVYTNAQKHFVSIKLSLDDTFKANLHL